MRQTWSLLTFPPVKQAGTGPPVQPGLLANRGELSGLLQAQSRERVHRLASLSHCLVPSSAPQPLSPFTSTPPPAYFSLLILKTKLFIEKQNVDLQILQLANPSVPGSAGLWRRAQVWAQCPGLSVVTSQEPGDPVP